MVRWMPVFEYDGDDVSDVVSVSKAQHGFVRSAAAGDVSTVTKAVQWYCARVKLMVRIRDKAS